MWINNRPNDFAYWHLSLWELDKFSYELSHPLASGDSDDYVLKVHDRVGWCLVYDDRSNFVQSVSVVLWKQIQFPDPGCFKKAASGDTSGYGDVPIKSIFSQVGGGFVSQTCEVQVAKITHGDGV